MLGDLLDTRGHSLPTIRKGFEELSVVMGTKRIPFDVAATRLTDTILGLYDLNLEEELAIVAATIFLQNIAYLRYVSHSDSRVLNSIVTYSPDWQTRYFDREYVLIDPVISCGSKAVLPFDWKELMSDDPAVRAFFEDAIAHGVGHNGISIPVRNRKGAYSLISFTGDYSTEGWNKYKKNNMSALQILSTLIDSAASVSRKTPVFPVTLSKTERLCLIFASQGKSYDDVAKVMNLTKVDVKRHLDTARHKLYCIDVNHAITVAVANGIIPQESRS